MYAYQMGNLPPNTFTFKNKGIQIEMAKKWESEHQCTALTLSRIYLRTQK